MEANEGEERTNFSALEDDPAHCEAETPLLQAPHIRREAQSGFNVANPLTPQEEAGKGVIPSSLSAGLISDPAVDIPKDEGQASQLGLASTNSSHVEIKTEGHPDSPDLAFPWYQPAPQLPLTGYTELPEIFAALEELQNVLSQPCGEVSPLSEAIRICEQLLCFIPVDGEFGIAIVSSLSEMLRSRYLLQSRRNSALSTTTLVSSCVEGESEPTSTDQGNEGVDGGFNNDETHELASLYLSSGREYLSAFQIGQDSDLLDLAVSSYQSATCLLPPTHSYWAAASLELVETLQVKHKLCGEPCELHLDEAVGICERVLAALPERSEDLGKVASCFSQVLRLRYQARRNHEDPPEPIHVPDEEHDIAPNSTHADSLEEGRDPLSEEENADLARFYLDTARDSFLTYRAEGYQDSMVLENTISSYRNVASLMVPTDPSWFSAFLEFTDALEESSRTLGTPPNSDIHREEAIEVYKWMLRTMPHDDENRREVILCYSWALVNYNLLGEIRFFEELTAHHIIGRTIDNHRAFQETRDQRILDSAILWYRKLRHLDEDTVLLVLALLERCGIDATPDLRLVKEALWLYDLFLPTLDANNRQLEANLSILDQIAQAATNLHFPPDTSARFLIATYDAIQRIATELSLTLHPDQNPTTQHTRANLLYGRYSPQFKINFSRSTDIINELVDHQTEVLRSLKALNSPWRTHVAADLALLLYFQWGTTSSGSPCRDQVVELLREGVFGCEIHRPVCCTYITHFLASSSLKAFENNDPGCAEEAILHCDEIAAFLLSCPEGSDPETQPLLDKIGETKRELEARHVSANERHERDSKKALKWRRRSSPDKSKDERGEAITPSESHVLKLLFDAMDLSQGSLYTEGPNLAEEAEAMWRQTEDFAKGTGSQMALWAAHLGPIIRATLPLPHDFSPHRIDEALLMIRTALESPNPLLDNKTITGLSQKALAGLVEIRLKIREGSPQELRQTMAFISKRSFPDLPEHLAIYWRARFTLLLEHTHDSPGYDFDAALRDIGFGDFESMSESIRSTLAQLQHLALISPNTRASLRAIQRQNDTTLSLSSFVLFATFFTWSCDSATSSRFFPIALTTMEELRSVVWTQATRRRHPADEVAEVAPELTSKLRELSSMLSNPIQNRGYLHELIRSNGLPAHPVGAATATETLPPLVTRRNIQREWDDVVNQIRCIPGFESFLKQKSCEELLGAALGGPVVILAALPGGGLSFAFMLYPEVREVEADDGKGKQTVSGMVTSGVLLEIGSEELDALRRQLRVSLGARNRRTPNSQSPQEAEGETYPATDTSDAREAEWPPEDAGSSRAGKKKRREDKDYKDLDMEGVLSVLWTKVTQPVVERLTAVEKPDINDRRRIWWCPTGPFAFMPLHAAGTADGMFRVFDFFISSYTPTLTALIQARERPIPVPESTKILAAIQPKPGHGWNNLPDTRAELQEVHKFVPNQHLISLSHPPGFPLLAPSTEESARRGIDLEGVHTTCENILSHLPTASVLHLACHGCRDKSDPLQDGFILRNGEQLTVEMLMKSQEEPGSGGRCIAILSACDTAAIDENLPDESINLANAMLFVGFRSVLATMWPMGDPDGPIIARAIYSNLFSREVNGDLSKFCLATVLDTVMREMREAGCYSCDRWATFIHIGA